MADPFSPSCGELGEPKALIKVKRAKVRGKVSASSKNDVLIEIEETQAALRESIRKARELSERGVDVQLHTHRHRTPLDRNLFQREIEDNRRCINEITGKEPAHFCYPSGVYARRFLPWLDEAGIKSATTCEVGFASRASHPLLLPRFLDNNTMAPIEFEAWLTGVSLALPRRR